MEVASDCDDHWLRVDLYKSKSKQGPRQTVLKKWILSSNVRIANSWAGIKPTAPLSVFDKENLMELLLDFLYYLYNYYIVCALSSCAYYVTSHVIPCDMTCDILFHVTVTHNTCDMTLSHTPFCVVSPRKKKKSKYK